MALTIPMVSCAQVTLVIGYPLRHMVERPASVIARAGHVLGQPRIRRAFKVAMGAILVAFGMRLAVVPH